MTHNEWVLGLGLSIPVLVIGAWLYMVNKEMKEAESKKKD